MKGSRVSHLRHDALALGDGRSVDQLPQLLVIHLQSAHALRLGAAQQAFSLELLVLSIERGVGYEEFAGAAEQFGENSRGFLEGEQDDGKGSPDVLEVAEPRIRHEQDERDQGEKRQPGEEAGTALEHPRRRRLHHSARTDSK